jgi:hypothetical protein
LEVERARGMGVPSGELYKGITASLRRIWTEEGIRGLYRGLGPVMLGYLPTWYVPESVFNLISPDCVAVLGAVADGRAVYFPVYEQCKKVYVSPGMVLVFLLLYDEYS